LELTIGGIPVVFKRGYVAVNASVWGKSYRFVNTHLEEREAGPIQALQTQELIGILGQETLPVILVGDLNSSPRDPVTESPYGKIVPPYKQLVMNGYADVWKRSLFTRGDPGYTCCQAENLSNTESVLYERVDHVFVRDNPHSAPFSIVGPVVAYLVGEEPKDKTPSGLWPSDHAGVVARMLIPTFK
jgi:endonuclease/exonuclease/phosphatase family metal-dependent hydrolase